MNPNYSEAEYNMAKYYDLLPCYCYNCNNIFYAKKSNITQEIKEKRGRVKFCSTSCCSKSQSIDVLVLCKNCGTKFRKSPSRISKNQFCCQSCSATYNNKHKTTGNRRSKLEAWLETKLIELYPDLEIRFNQKDTINSELDIYIPSLKLAFELNGIFHYEPIYGQDKLNQIQNNDNRKFQACIEHEIDFCIIDTSTQNYFKELSSKKFLDIITTIIHNKINLLNI